MNLQLPTPQHTLGHSYWAEAAAYSIDTQNLIPSRRHPNHIPLELFTGKRQTVAHTRVFGSKCWAKIPTVNGAQVTGGSKLDPRSVECRLLGYAPGAGNYKVQDIVTRRIYVSRDVVFEEGYPHRTLTSVGENFEAEAALTDNPLVNHDSNTPSNRDPEPVPDPAIASHHVGDIVPDQTVSLDQQHTPVIPTEPRQST